MFRNARIRLTLWYAAVFSPILLVLAVAAYIAMGHALNAQAEDSIHSLVDDWRVRAVNILSQNTATTPDPRFRGATAGVFLIFVRPDGSVAALSRDVTPSTLLKGGIASKAIESGDIEQTVSIEGERVRLYGTPIYRDQEVIGALVGGRSLSQADALVRDAALVLGGVVVVGLVLCLGAGYLLADRALRPIAAAYQRQRMFVADASHELRSPIAVIRAAADLLMREDLPRETKHSIEEIRDVADEAGRLVDRLLDLARAQAQRSGATETSIDLAEAVRHELDRMLPLLTGHDTTVTTNLESAPAYITSSEAYRILRALLENVLAHTPRGTTVRISTRSDGRRSHLVVEDNGPGVSPSLFEKIFERFARGGDGSRSPGEGTGLGLAIVREIARRRNGTTHASTAGRRGLRVEVSFPRAGDAITLTIPTPTDRPLTS